MRRVRRSLSLLAAPWLVASLLLLGACQGGDIPSRGAATKPPEPPPPVAAPLPSVRTEALAPGMAGQAPVKAALLVPLSGPSAAAGQALLNAAQLALFELSDKNFSLVPLDTGGTAEGAAAAAQQALGQGAQVILGPLFSAEVKAASPAARGARVPMIAFSSDRTAAGDGVWVVGFLPQPQVERVAGQARSQGAGRFAVVAPATDYGRATTSALQGFARANGASVTLAESYDPNAGDYNELARRVGQAAAAGQFEAILLPDQGPRLRNIASLLTYNGLDKSKVRMLGTMLWGEEPLGNEPALAGGWYPAPPVSAWRDFETRYARSFGNKPPRVATLAYDATALAAVIARQPRPDFSPATLLNPSGFAGTDGIFRLLPDGTAQRGLAVWEVTPSGPREVSPAPSSFAGGA